MGGTGSTGRKVSFGLDDDDRVRVLRGIRLSEDVVNRMKDSPSPSREQNACATSTPELSPSGSRSVIGTPEPRASSTGSNLQNESCSTPRAKECDEDLYRKYEREQVIIHDELARIAKREREAARETLNASILREKNFTNEERKKVAHLAKELERKEAELKRMDAFHKEELARIEKKNKEIYKQTSEQFHTAAINAEYRVKCRSYEPVCKGLQSKILSCYQANRQEVLNCSDLAKEYRRCVSDAQKALLVNHG